MPKLRKTAAELSAEKRERTIKLLGQTIKSACEFSCGHVEDASQHMRVFPATLYNHIRNAERLNVGDLWDLKDIIPEEQKESIRRMILP